MRTLSFVNFVSPVRFNSERWLVGLCLQTPHHERYEWLCFRVICKEKSAFVSFSLPPALISRTLAGGFDNVGRGEVIPEKIPF